MLLEGSCKIKEIATRYIKSKNQVLQNINIQSNKRLFIYAKTFHGLPMRDKRSLYWLIFQGRCFATNFLGEFLADKPFPTGI